MVSTLKKSCRRILDRALASYLSPERWRADMERNAILSAHLLIDQQASKGILPRIRDAEFRVFSQFGEDGIIQYLIRQVPIASDSFIEFGVEDYSESNTRFLLSKNNWRGLILDGWSELPQHIAKTPLAWRHELTARTAFITAENINSLISAEDFSGDIGLLSVDVDGNDYWIWNAVNVVSPRIVVCEYNSLFGCRYAVSVPYQPDFNKTQAHFSNLYFGASLPALCLLAERRGYRFVGSNSTGHNAFFVREDVAAALPKAEIANEFVRSRFRSSLNEEGQLTLLTGTDRTKVISDLPVINVATGETMYVRDL